MKKKREYKKLKDWLHDALFHKPVWVVLFILFFGFFFLSLGTGSGIFAFQLISKILLYVAGPLYTIFYIFVMIGRSLNHMLTAQSLWKMAFGYVLCIFGIILLLSMGYYTIDALGKGYLTYGTCSDKFDPSMISSDALRSSNHLYFAAITFFTVGYGDVCPMGWSKLLAIINASIGHFFSAVVMVIVVTLYFKRRYDPK